jgi:hypothetical protein
MYYLTWFHLLLQKSESSYSIPGMPGNPELPFYPHAVPAPLLSAAFSRSLLPCSSPRGRGEVSHADGHSFMKINIFA